MIVRTWTCARGHVLELEDDREHPETLNAHRRAFVEGGCTVKVTTQAMRVYERCGAPMTESR